MTINYNFRRQRHPRTLGKKLIIGCEGKETERLYFNAIRIDLRIPKERIIISFKGSSPVLVVDNVIAIKSELSRQSADGQEFNINDGDEAWAVFDGDEHIQSSLASWQAALKKAAENNVRLAISNPCIELWFLLHFQDQTANIDRAQARRAVKEHIPNFEKNRDFYVKYLQNKTKDAIRRSVVLDSVHARNANPHYQNPSSGVHRLVSTLLGLADNE